MLKRKPCEDPETPTGKKEEGHAKMEAVTGVRQLRARNAKDCQESPEARKREEDPAKTLILQTSSLQN